ncbi:MAG: hypothetical protein IPK97_06150 [Ahniella sp.]|nr:hypothetical protein [Ahniella sp.]
MSKRRRSKSRSVRSHLTESQSASASSTAAAERWAQQVDWRELATGAFVVTMLLIGSKISPDLFTHASDVLLAQVMFEFPMALLAVCAGQAIRHASTAMRAATVLVGLFGVALAGSVKAVQLDAPWAIASGAWLLASRVAPPRGIAWFSIDHCRAIELTAGTAWACLVVAILLLMLGSGIAPSKDDGQSAHAIVYVVAWGAYYLGLGLLLPQVRRRFNRQRRR